VGRKPMGDTRRPQILEGLLKALGEHGLRELNMSRVARAANVSRGILHYYFKNKDEMLAALVSHLRDTHLRHFQDHVAARADPSEQMRAALIYPVERFGPAGATLAKVWIEFWGLSNRQPQVKAFILSLQGELRRIFSGIVERGQESGAFRKDLDPRQLAALILGALEGLMLQWHFDPASVSFIKELMALEDMIARALKP
jgi:TetR/AcrR family fatty acid metabolism transcriptional regulator